MKIRVTPRERRFPSNVRVKLAGDPDVVAVRRLSGRRDIGGTAVLGRVQIEVRSLTVRGPKPT